MGRQQVPAFCAEHDACKKVKGEKVRFRYVIDMETLKREAA